MAKFIAFQDSLRNRTCISFFLSTLTINVVDEILLNNQLVDRRLIMPDPSLDTPCSLLIGRSVIQLCAGEGGAEGAELAELT